MPEFEERPGTSWDKMTPPEGWECGTRVKEEHLNTNMAEMVKLIQFEELGDNSPQGEIPANAPSDEAMNALAIEILRLCDGLPVSAADRVLNQAQRFLKCSTRLDCAGPDFAQAAQLFGRSRAR